MLCQVEVEAEYRSAIKAICSAQSSFDAQELSELNASARTKAGEATSSLGDLASSVKACQETLADLQDRLGLVETELEGLLAMVQSVTFVSENSSDYAVAYYDMDLNGESTPEGYKPRIPKNTIGLTYMVRPATAASAFVDQKLWNQDIKVIGYYANRIQQAAVPTVMDFEIETVSASPETGMVSVTVKNDLSEDFFYKKTGAKLALSVATGKTDLSSKFVEIVPQDASGKIYLESIRLSEQKVELAVGETFKVSAILSPEDVSDKYVTWSSGNTNIMTVENRTLTENVVTAVSEGSTTLTVTTSGTDEWGRHLTASCPVKVNPAIRLLGPAYVEQGKTAELTLDFPPAMVVESKVWLVDDDHKDYATVADGVVTGVKDTYNSYTYDYTTLTVTCIVNGDITLTHDMKVVVPQPRQIKFNNYADNVTSVDMKVDESISFAATILPNTVNAGQFRLFYESDGGLGWIESSTGFVKAPQTPGARYVYANVFNVDKHHYFAPGASLRRTVVVKVHPYYVQKIEFSQPTMTLSPDQTASLSPIFTSDVTGKQPTYKDLKWVSSNPDVVSVNATTGEIKTLKEGSATITATTANTWSIPSGDNHKSASCTIIVKKPSDPVYVGDFFYSDGTWSTELNKSKVLRGIVCQTGAASATDKHLPTTCTNGYVISVEEVAAILDADANVSADKFNTWAQSHGYYAIEAGDGSWNGAKETSAYGYSNTSAYMELTEQKAHDELGTSWSGAHYGGWDFYYTSGGLDNFRKNNPVDTSKSSNWYVPSQKEMTFVSDDVLSAVNAALSAAGKTQITNKNYKTSSYNKYGNAVVVNPVAKSATQQSVSTEGSLRFFLAF